MLQLFQFVYRCVLALFSAGTSEGVPLLLLTAGLAFSVTDGLMVDILVDLPPLVLATFIPALFLRLVLNNTSKNEKYWEYPLDA